jgi:hypothetical protein
VVLPYIAVGEHIITEPLCVPEARTVPQHQPGVRPQHGNMVGNSAGIGRTSSDAWQGG